MGNYFQSALQKDPNRSKSQKGLKKSKESVTLCWYVADGKLDFQCDEQ